ncbi:MAG TPA: NAD(P)-dependent oxidoreductase [Gemmataceae bacterium]|nr:NAD(P)-dependent oxidoreductase [Gemmataceae bacterium]
MIGIIGGNGFVGSAFVRHCQRVGLAHATIDRENYIAMVGREWDILINANGNSKKFLANEEPLEEFDASVRSVRRSLQDFRAGCYVHLSTCDIYPNCSSPAATRETGEPDVAKQSTYGFHKYLAEQCVRHAAGRWLIFRMGGFVGHGLKKNPIHDILHGQPLWLDPGSELQFLNTDDAAGMIFRILESGIHHEIVNLCGSGVVALSEVLSLVSRPVAIRPNSPRVRYEVSIEKLAGLTWVPDTRKTVLSFVTSELVRQATVDNAA